MKDKLLEYKGYFASIDISLEDGCLFGKVEFINDSIIFGGNDLQEITEQFHTEIDEYLEFCEQVGKSPDKTLTGSFNVRLGPELHKKALIKAKQCDMKLNEVMKAAVEQYVTQVAEVHNHINIHQPQPAEQDVFTSPLTEDRATPSLRLVN